MKTLTTAFCSITVGMLIVVPSAISAERGGGGGFGGGGFHGGSIGSAGHVNNAYYGGGYSDYTYPMGPVGFEGDSKPSGSGSGSGPAKAYTGSATVPPPPLEDGRGVYVPLGPGGSAAGPSWNSDWWAQDPPGAAAEAVAASDATVGTAVASLPRGYETVYLSTARYYFFEGTYYQAADSGYQVVAPPLGAEVQQLPNTAEMVKVDKQQYFIYNDTYYQALFAGSGIVYKVVEDPHSG